VPEVIALRMKKSYRIPEKIAIFTKRVIPGFTAAVRRLSPVVETNGKPTKPMPCTSTTESAGGNRLTYERELPNSGRQVILTKRIIPEREIKVVLAV
jgi:hypothetical protein